MNGRDPGAHRAFNECAGEEVAFLEGPPGAVMCAANCMRRNGSRFHDPRVVSRRVTLGVRDDVFSAVETTVDMTAKVVHWNAPALAMDID